MPKKLFATAVTLISILGWTSTARAQQPRRPTVVLISIDGLRPDYVLEAGRRGVRAPHLRRLVADGVSAGRVRGVIPTVTYPSHTTMITGVSPAKHGIFTNTTFDPFWKNFDGWYWYAEDIHVPTLWDAALGAGMVTSNVHWPVSVGAKITYNLPQIWRSGHEDDRKMLRALATPGLIDELERDLGPYADGIGESMPGDEVRGRFAVRLLEQKRPNFMTAYFTALDHEEHESGPFSPASLAVLEKIDAIVGTLVAAAERRDPGNAVVCVVSDHGFVATSKVVNLYAAFRAAGLMAFDDKNKPTSWQATPWAAGGSAAIVINPAASPEARAAVRFKVAGLLKELAADPASGIAQVLDAGALHARGGFPDAEFLVDMKPGYFLGRETSGPLVTPTKTAGMHGYLPSLPEMVSSFFIAGAGIGRGRSLGEIDMRDIAPTIATLLGVTLPAAEGKSLPVRDR
ncbi:MAG: alkaline phosphatase family protein [Candidatus Solibacter usitatus]|nr:alkaline phosphatase family protein [Candidatus Solibacter usitatus]